MAYTTINKPNTHFDTTLFTGDNASGRTFTGLNFAPDMIWGKSRDTTNLNHQIVDIVRGGTKFLFTNSNVAEDTASHGQITSWNSDGTTWADGTNGTYPRLYYNDNGQLGGAGSRVWWQWKANGAGVSNNSGTITSTVSANTTSGFSIFTYTGTGASITTVGHGCSSEPKFVIVKNRSSTGAWVTYHYGAGATGLGNPNQASLILNGTNASANPASGGYLSDGYFSNVNSTTITLRDVNNANNVNANGNNYVGYAFAEVKGFSKFGKYTGNGSADGTFVYTGFKPAWVMVKCSSTTGDWLLADIKRLPINVMNGSLAANLSNEESYFGGNNIDFISNGFKLRTTNGVYNSSGATYIYAAFAENPLVGTNNVPATAR